MKVLVVTTWYPSESAPQAALFVQRDVEVIARQHVVHVLHLTPSAANKHRYQATVWNGIPVTRVHMSPGRPDQVFAAARAAKAMLGEFDVIHTMALSSLLPLALMRTTIPWMHTEHWSGIVAPETVPRVMRLTMPFTMRLIRRPDLVVAVSGYLAEHIERIRRGPVRVIPNAVLRPDVLTDRRALRQPVRAIAVGGLIPRKGPELALAAVDELRRRGIDVGLTWIGDGPMRSALERETKTLGLADRVHWVGSRSPAAVSDELSRSDVFILPTKSETFGVAIAEALAHGRPVVVGSVGGQSEFVHPPCGVLVRERTAVAYADAIGSVIGIGAELTAHEIANSLGNEFSEAGREQAYSDAYDALASLPRDGRAE